MTWQLTPQRWADTYDWCGPLVRDLVRAEFDPTAVQVIDIGPCWGKYRELLPEYVMDACEAWLPYVEQEKLRDRYRHVYVSDVCDLVKSAQWQHYDVVIMGDVLEHIARPAATELVRRVLSTCGELVVVVPYQYKQGPEHGNPHQCHQQADLTPEIMAAQYPGLRLAATEVRNDVPFKGLYRRQQ
jgi:hypothetical protein